jgi:polysaccharide deacetylase family protein (PEP-CTERM system associated)
MRLRQPAGGAAVVNAMSVDVEDYFHVSVFDGIVPRSTWDDMESRVVANTQRLLEIFEESGVKSTFFILGWVAERHTDLVRAIADRGHEVASHGYAHRLVYDQTPDAFREDVRRAKHVIEDATGQGVRGYRAPSYSITPRSLWALDILIEEGHSYDASIFPIRHDRYGIPVSPREPFPVERDAGALMEVPGSTVRVGPLNLPVGGGGYFRILPYQWTRWGIGSRVLPSSVGDRPRAATTPRRMAGALSSLPQSFNDGITAEGAPDRLSLLDSASPPEHPGACRHRTARAARAAVHLVAARRRVQPADRDYI